MATTQAPPFNPNQQKIELAPNNYGKPMQRPLQMPDPSSLKRKKKLPAQGDWGNSPAEGGGLPVGGPFDNSMRPPTLGGISNWPDNGGVVGPRPVDRGGAGGLSKNGTWTPPTQEYLDGLKNGSIEPKWKEQERQLRGGYGPIRDMGPGNIGQPGPGGWTRGGGRMDPWGSVTGGNPKPAPQPGGEYIPGPSYGGGPSGRGGAETGAPSYGDAIQRGPGAPRSGGKPAQPPVMGGGRQPLRQGMEYRPGGGQRPAGGGGMRGAPQDGGQSQLPGDQYDVSGNDPGRGQRVNDMYGVDSTGWYDENGQLTDQGNQGWENYNQANPGGGEQTGSMSSQSPDQMNAWRQKLMQMQKQGPNSNPYYGAF